MKTIDSVGPTSPPVATWSIARRICLLVGALIFSLLAGAHEFWLQPSQFFAQPGQTIQVQTLVGENFTGERSEGKKTGLCFINT